MKRAYVATVRGLRAVARRFGLLGLLERRRDRRLALWLRSLFAIHDIDDLVALDLPWWCLHAVDEVEAYLAGVPGARVFEYGSGASTLWLAKRAGSVVSVEHDGRWADAVRERTRDLDHVELRHVPPDLGETGEARYLSAKPGWRGRSFERYVRSIEDGGDPYDLIVIDGRARGACLGAAHERLAPGGMIVFDNSGRRRYRDAIARCPLRAVTCVGLTACLPYPDRTTLLTRS